VGEYRNALMFQMLVPVIFSTFVGGRGSQIGKLILGSMKWRIFQLLLLSALLYPSCSQRPHIAETQLSGYDFSKPDKLVILPEILHEVSGVTALDSATVLCIQDEKGIVFQYNVIKDEIVHEYPFEMDGDFEGVALAGLTVFVLRSDGVLYEIADYTKPHSKVVSHETNIPSQNNEGLCYDAQANRLLIACKSKPGKGPGFKDKRVIYAFDLDSKTLSAEPVFNFDLDVIRKFALENDVQIPTRQKKNDKAPQPIIKFKPSAIMIHPATNQLYLLSASDHMLFVFDRKGTIEHIELLDQNIFNKSEGITFFSNGDALITNEGQEGKPTLLRFRYRK